MARVAIPIRPTAFRPDLDDFQLDQLQANSADDLDAGSSRVLTLQLRGHNRSYRQKTGRALWPKWRKRAAEMLETKAFDLLLGTVIFSNILVMCLEVDANADCPQGEFCAGAAIYATNIAFIVFYLLECCMRFFVYRMKTFEDPWNILDVAIVVLGWLELLLAQMRVLEQFDMNINFLRIFRVARLMRATRVLRVFPELHAMIIGFASAMMAMFWGFVMILGMLLVWSILAVEFVHPVNKGLPHDDEWCEVAFSSVGNSVIIFFQTLVAGDSWGHCTIPIIREYPALFMMFSLSLVSVQLGFTNLILSAIVDSASKAREEDKEHRLEAAKKKRQDATNVLLDILVQIDTDDSGAVSYEELEEGYYENSDFKQILEQLGLGPDDLRMLFDVMDSDRSGAVSYHEFVSYIQNVSIDQLQQHLFLARFLKKRDDIVDALLSRLGVGHVHASRSSRTHSRASKLSLGKRMSLLSHRGSHNHTQSVQSVPHFLSLSSAPTAISKLASFSEGQERSGDPNAAAAEKDEAKDAQNSAVLGERAPGDRVPASERSELEENGSKDNSGMVEELTKFSHLMQVRHTQMALGLSQIVNDFEACTNRLLISLKYPPTPSGRGRSSSPPYAGAHDREAGVAPALESTEQSQQQQTPQTIALCAETSASRIFVPKVKGDEGPSPGFTLRLGKNWSTDSREPSKGSEDETTSLSESAQTSKTQRSARILTEGVQIEF